MREYDETHRVAYVRVEADVEFESDIERQTDMIDSVVELINRVVADQRK